MEYFNNYISTITSGKWMNYQGRARRKEFWSFALVNIIIAIVLSIILAILSLIPGIGIIFRILTNLLSLAIMIVMIPIAIRRLHDTNKSGWLMIVGAVLGVLVMIFSWFGPALAVLTMILSLIALVWGIVLLVFYCTPGDVGPNQYGPDPKA